MAEPGTKQPLKQLTSPRGACYQQLRNFEIASGEDSNSPMVLYDGDTPQAAQLLAGCLESFGNQEAQGAAKEYRDKYVPKSVNIKLVLQNGERVRLTINNDWTYKIEVGVHATSGPMNPNFQETNNRSYKVAAQQFCDKVCGDNEGNFAKLAGYFHAGKAGNDMADIFNQIVRLDNVRGPPPRYSPQS